VLVDGGWAVVDARDTLGSALAAMGSGVGDVRRILVTHAHRDHYSQAVALRRELGIRVGLGAGEGPSLREVRRRDHVALAPQLDQMRRSGAGALADAVLGSLRGHAATDRSLWQDPDDWLEEGPIVLEGGGRLDAVATPGHTRGHLVFGDRARGLLFAGDHVLPSITPSIGFEAVPAPDPLGAFLAALARVRGMPDAMLLPAHGPVAPSVHRRVDELVDHHGRRLDETARAVAAGATSGWEVARRLRWTRRRRILGALDLFNQMLAVTETRAHLVLLAAQGRVRMVTDDHGAERCTAT
jgi:glyoxylase-like metal-dependent hydrolase (beta-lactamase superfamily II)